MMPFYRIFARQEIRVGFREAKIDLKNYLSLSLRPLRALREKPLTLNLPMPG
jgi:hypothetical protein